MPIIRENNEKDRIRHLIGTKFKQKMVDILMSLDIADISFERQVDYIILIAGDSDFVPAIKKAKECRVIVHLFYHKNSIHNQILDEVDERHEITEKIINDCKNL